jgi:GNAT superfamily N-acetyltransferase
MSESVLETRPATGDDFQYVWSVYSDSIKDHITPHLKSGWDDAVEIERFRKIWNAADSHIIMVDQKPVGWGGVVISEKEVRIEHLYIEGAHRGKHIGPRLVSEMAAQWTREGKIVRAELLKDERIMELASHIGFEKTESDSDHPLTHTFTYKSR